MKISSAVRHFCTVAAWVVIPSTIAFFLFPHQLKVPFTNEDRLIETAATFLYVASALSAFFIVRNSKDLYVKGVGWFLTFTSVLLLLEETSFGRNMIYKYDRPKLFDAGIDTFHDIFLVIAYGIVDYNSPIAYLMAFGIILFVGLFIFYFFTRQKDFTFRFIGTPTFVFLALALALLILAAILDIVMSDGGTRNLHAIFFEEMLELFAAYSVLYATTLFRREHFTKELPR